MVSFLLTDVIFGAVVGCMSGRKSRKKVSSKVEWSGTQTANLVRRNGAIYYAQIKIQGKTFRKSLVTEKLTIARMKLAGKLSEIRAAAVNAVVFDAAGGGDVTTLGACLGRWIAGERLRPDLKTSTKEYNERRYEDLMRTLPVGVVATGVKSLVLRTWWQKVADDYNPQYANNLLSIAQHALDMQVEAGLIKENLLAKCKRLKIPKVIRELPSGAQMAALIADVRGQKSRFAEESADMITMMAYSGMRPAEVWALEGKRDLLADKIVVRSGKEGTKNYEERVVPIMDELRAVVARRRKIEGSIWSIKSPENAMRRSAKRLEFGFTVGLYACRHFFVTRCLENGVDIPTVARWVGHRDGGITLMKNYAHVTDQHGMEIAKTVKFG